MRYLAICLAVLLCLSTSSTSVAMARNQRFPDVPVAAVGTVRSYTASGGWQIASVIIDNPSGMWLELRPSYTLIPPNTLGRIISLDPRSQTINLVYVDAPIGGVASAVTGGPISVQAFDEILTDDVGTDYTLIPTIQNLTTAIAALQGSIDGLVMGWGSANVPLYFSDSFSANDGLTVVLTAGAGQQIVLLQASASIEVGYYPVRGIVYASIEIPGERVDLALTSERPSDVIPFPPGAMVANAGEDIEVETQSPFDPIEMLVSYRIWYYIR